MDSKAASLIFVYLNNVLLFVSLTAGLLYCITFRGTAQWLDTRFPQGSLAFPEPTWADT